MLKKNLTLNLYKLTLTNLLIPTKTILQIKKNRDTIFTDEGIAERPASNVS